MSDVIRVKKKVTKIIRNDGTISYRPAGGNLPQPKSPNKQQEPGKSHQSDKKGKKKCTGKVIKRADGTTIVVVDGKIVKTTKSKQLTSESPNVVSQVASPEKNPPTSPIRISADEISPVDSDAISDCELSISSDYQSFKANARQNVDIKRTITVDRLSDCTDDQKKVPVNSKDRKSVEQFIERRIDSSHEQSTDKPHSRKVERSNERTRTSARSTERYPLSSTERPTLSEKLTEKWRSRPNQRPLSRERDPTRLRDIIRDNRVIRDRDEKRSNNRHQVKSQGYTKSYSRTRRSKESYHPSRHNIEADRQPSPKRQRRSRSPAKGPPASKTIPMDSISVISKLLEEKIPAASKEDMLNMIQKQAESMLKAQHSGPIDEQKRKRLREAMESILIERGFIRNCKTSSSSIRHTASSDSSDGRESPPIMKKLHKKYLESDNDNTASSSKCDHEAISPCIDNISIASDSERKLSDVSLSDMELSDEEKKKDNEDGRTPAFRRKREKIVEDISSKDEPTPQLIQIKLGKDAEEEAFKELASRLEELKTSADVQNLIEAIENKIKSLLTIDLEPSSLEKKIRRYQMLVAKVVMKAESIKEGEEESSKVTYHRYNKEKDSKTKSNIAKNQEINKPSISYPVQTNEQKKPWLYHNSQDRSNVSSKKESQLLQPPINTELQKSEGSDPVERVQLQYVSQRPGYHVCLLCMIESNNESQFQKHLDGKKHQEAVRVKIKQISTPPNTKKFKKHNLVIKCKLCDVTCISQKKYNDHCSHRSHQALIQAYVKIGRVVPEPEIIHDQQDNIQEKIAVIQESGTPAVGREFMSAKTVKDCDDNVVDVYFCSLCKVNCSSEVQVERHVRSKKHYLIYVKVTQPEVDIQVNAAEHKKRRETTKKIVSTMKTIKQMEEVIERNRESLNQKHVPVPNVPVPNDAIHRYTREEPYSNVDKDLGRGIAPMYAANTSLPGHRITSGNSAIASGGLGANRSSFPTTLQQPGHPQQMQHRPTQQAQQHQMQHRIEERIEMHKKQIQNLRQMQPDQQTKTLSQEVPHQPLSQQHQQGRQFQQQPPNQMQNMSSSSVKSIPKPLNQAPVMQPRQQPSENMQSKSAYKALQDFSNSFNESHKEQVGSYSMIDKRNDAESPRAIPFVPQNKPHRDTYSSVYNSHQTQLSNYGASNTQSSAAQCTNRSAASTYQNVPMNTVNPMQSKAPSYPSSSAQQGSAYNSAGHGSYNTRYNEPAHNNFTTQGTNNPNKPVSSYPRNTSISTSNNQYDNVHHRPRTDIPQHFPQENLHSSPHQSAMSWPNNPKTNTPNQSTMSWPNNPKTNPPHQSSMPMSWPNNPKTNTPSQSAMSWPNNPKTNPPHQSAMSWPNNPKTNPPHQSSMPMSWPNNPKTNTPSQSAMSWPNNPKTNPPHQSAMSWPNNPKTNTPNQSTMSWPNNPRTTAPQESTMSWPTAPNANIPQVSGLPNSAKVFAGPTYSGKPTYSGVYTNVKRGL